MFCILAKYVIPPINNAMTARQDAIRDGVRRARPGQGRGRRGRGRSYKAQLDRRPPRGRAHPRGGSRAGGPDHRRDAREAQAEADAHRRARPRPDRGRAARRRSPRCGRGRHAWPPTLAGRIVGESLDDDERQRPRGRPLPRRPRGAEQMDLAGASLMLGPPRERAAELDGRSSATDEGVGDARRRAVRGRAVLRAEPALRRVATDARSRPRPSSGLASRCSRGQVGEPALDVLTDAVGRRWTRRARPGRRLEGSA